MFHSSARRAIAALAIGIFAVGLSATPRVNAATETKTAVTQLAMNDQAQSITTERVAFESGGRKLVGTLYLPAARGDDAALPGVVVTGAWTTVKEQMPKTYAEQLAAQGFAALTFDFRGWGESEGDNRYLEDPARKTEDIIAAAHFLRARDGIDSARVAGLGICASSGYMVKAYAQSDALAKIALVAPWLHNREIVEQVYGGAQSVAKLIETGERAAAAFETDGALQTITAASATDADALMPQVPYYTEPDRGLIAQYDNRFNLASWKGWLTFDAIAYAAQIPGKILFVESEAMALPQGSAAFKAIAGDKVESVNLENVTQFDFYDRPDPVAQSVASVADYLRANL